MKIGRQKVKCSVCGKSWSKNNRQGPQHCPFCGSEGWNRPVVFAICRRCGHLWKPRQNGEDFPATCPKCRVARWWEERSTRRIPIKTSRATYAHSYDRIQAMFGIVEEMENRPGMWMCRRRITA